MAFDIIEEIRAIKKNIVRGGEVREKVFCPEGYWYDPEKQKCVKVTGSMLVKKKRIAKKAARTRKRHRSKNRISMRKSKRLTERAKRQKRALLAKRPKIVSA